MQKAEHVENLIIGKFYSVACAEMVNPNESVVYVPIIPILHRDPQFGTAGSFEHYHLDGRFISQDVIATMILYEGRTNNIIAPKDINAYFRFKKVVRKRRKCVRLITGLNLNNSIPAPEKWLKWYKTMIGKSCAGKKCPHYGTQMIETNGRLVCPLHNLEGSIETNKIIEPILSTWNNGKAQTST